MNDIDEHQCCKLLGDSRKFFTCPILHIRMRKTECVARQLRQPMLSQGTRVRFLLYNEPSDHFCRSKKCEKGKYIKIQLRKRK
jgi:hypothetical protein